MHTLVLAIVDLLARSSEMGCYYKESQREMTRISCHWQTRATRCITANVLQTSHQLAATAPAFNLPDLHLAHPLGWTSAFWILPIFSALEN